MQDFQVCQLQCDKSPVEQQSSGKGLHSEFKQCFPKSKHEDNCREWRLVKNDPLRSLEILTSCCSFVKLKRADSQSLFLPFRVNDSIQLMKHIELAKRVALFVSLEYCPMHVLKCRLV